MKNLKDHDTEQVSVRLPSRQSQKKFHLIYVKAVPALAGQKAGMGEVMPKPRYNFGRLRVRTSGG